MSVQITRPLSKHQVLFRATVSAHVGCTSSFTKNLVRECNDLADVQHCQCDARMQHTSQQTSAVTLQHVPHLVFTLSHCVWSTSCRKILLLCYSSTSGVQPRKDRSCDTSLARWFAVKIALRWLLSLLIYALVKVPQSHDEEHNGWNPVVWPRCHYHVGENKWEKLHYHVASRWIFLLQGRSAGWVVAGASFGLVTHRFYVRLHQAPLPCLWERPS